MAELTRVHAGDPLSNISAGAYNAFIEAAEDLRQRRLSNAREAQATVQHSGIILVRNATAGALGRFAVVGLDSPVILPSSSIDGFQQRVALECVVPTSAHAGRFAILYEPLPAGAIGRAYALGVCVAQVHIESDSHTHADVKSGDSSQLLSAESGVAQLLWVEPGGSPPRTAWAVIRLGGGGGGTVVASWLGKIVSHIAGALYEVWEVVDSSPTPNSPLQLAIKSGGKHVSATNLVELGAGPGGAGFGGITAAPGGITPPLRYVVVHEINAGAGVRYIFESYPGQLINPLYAFVVTGLDENGCPCGGWFEMTGPAFISANPAIPACLDPPEED